MGKEDFLLSQIDEFREKAKQLQQLLASKEDKVQELKEIVAEREGKAQKLSDMIEERKDAAERVVTGVQTQIDAMMENTGKRFDELNASFAQHLAENEMNQEKQREAVQNMAQECKDQLQKTIEGLDGRLEKFQQEISEKVHNESVACYRNIQALLSESEQKLEEVNATVSKISSIKKISVAILIFVLMQTLGLLLTGAYLFNLI